MMTIGLLHPGEMSVGPPDGVRRGASDVCRRMAIYKGAPAPPSTGSVAKALRKESGS